MRTMSTLIIYYRDGSRQVVKPLQGTEKPRHGKSNLIAEEMPKNFCGDWQGLAKAIAKENYFRYEVI